MRDSFADQFIYLFVNLLINLFIYLFIYLFIHLFIYLFIYFINNKNYFANHYQIIKAKCYKYVNVRLSIP
jgi:hypothetical protein